MKELKTWEECKLSGSSHYKTGSVEPIDLYVAGDMFRDHALTGIIKYAYRSRRNIGIDKELFVKNMDKILDYAEKLKAWVELV